MDRFKPSQKLFLLKGLVSIALCCYSAYSIANTRVPYQPHFILQTGAGTQTQAAGEAFLPLSGNRKGFAYADVAGQYGNDGSWYGSFGLGGRQVLQGRILGAYAFIDRDRTIGRWQNDYWWVFNPGIEMVTKRWDARINTYFPISQRLQSTNGPAFFGDQLPAGTIHYEQHFAGHTRFMQEFVHHTLQAIPVGVDADVGYTVKSLKALRGWRVHGGGYYYKYTQGGFSQVTGAETGIVAPITRHLALRVDGSYDNLNHSTAIVSLSFNFGGLNLIRSNPSLEQHLTDPVRRHVGTLYTSSAIPVQEKQEYAVLHGGEQVVNLRNIWFFNGADLSAGGAISANSCTYENPCSVGQFDQSSLSQIATLAPSANLFLSPGSFTAYTLGAPSTPITVQFGQQIFGRTIGFLEAAGTSEVVLNGALVLSSQTSLNNITLFNITGSDQTVGLTLNNAQDVTLNNVVVGVISGDATQAFRNAIALGNQSSLTANNVQLNAYSEGDIHVYDIHIVGDANNLTLTHATLNAINNVANRATGIWIDNNSGDHSNYNTILLQNGTLVNVSGLIEGRGIWLDGSSTSDIGGAGFNGANYNSIVIDQSTITVAGDETQVISIDGTAASDGGIAGQGGNNGANYNTILIKRGSVLSAAGSSESSGISVLGLAAGDDGGRAGDGANHNTITVQEGSSISARGSIAEAVIVNGNSASNTSGVANNGANYNTITVDNTALTANATAAEAYAFQNTATIGIALGNTYNIRNNSTLRVNALTTAYGIFDTYALNGNPNFWNINIPNANFNLTGASICQQSYAGVPC